MTANPGQFRDMIFKCDKDFPVYICVLLYYYLDYIFGYWLIVFNFVFLFFFSSMDDFTWRRLRFILLSYLQIKFFFCCLHIRSYVLIPNKYYVIIIINLRTEFFFILFFICVRMLSSCSKAPSKLYNINYANIEYWNQIKNSIENVRKVYVAPSTSLQDTG